MQCLQACFSTECRRSRSKSLMRCRTCTCSIFVPVRTHTRTHARTCLSASACAHAMVMLACQCLPDRRNRACLQTLSDCPLVLCLWVPVCARACVRGVHRRLELIVVSNSSQVLEAVKNVKLTSADGSAEGSMTQQVPSERARALCSASCPAVCTNGPASLGTPSDAACVLGGVGGCVGCGCWCRSSRGWRCGRRWPSVSKRILLSET